MAYLRIDDFDFSNYVNKLKVSVKKNYKAQTNAAGDTIAQYINSKRVIEVSFIQMGEAKMVHLQSLLDGFIMNVSYLNPETRTLDTIECMVTNYDAEYYSIINNYATFKPCTITFQEL